MIRILLVDDHPVFRHGLRTLLDVLPDLEVIGEASNGSEAILMAETEHPDVVVMDLHMAGVDGVTATRRITQRAPETGVLVLTMFDDDESVFAAMRAGARGYLVKGADSPDVLRAISAVAQGEAIFGPGVAERVLGYLTRPLSARDDVVFPELTERERDVLELIAAGRSNGDIAARLCLSPKTIRNNVSSVFAKLQVADRSEAIVRARRAGLGVADSENR
ncbi:response regulator transcription factor [Rathayibacter soli]|uniref:response regulator transcription factor n=1 Tax=Rathayibacter soli TaxID=3144168 RepID=UPI0027E3C85D|nr:response regulator transcription factor [Glaciibacter superstes]